LFSPAESGKLISERAAMDSVTLISEIKRMPALWDKQNKNFSNRIITTKNWQLIANKMGVTSK